MQWIDIRRRRDPPPPSSWQPVQGRSVQAGALQLPDSFFRAYVAGPQVQQLVSVWVEDGRGAAPSGPHIGLVDHTAAPAVLSGLGALNELPIQSLCNPMDKHLLLVAGGAGVPGSPASPGAGGAGAVDGAAR